MPRELKGFRVFIASPSGLADIRQAFRNSIHEHNECCALRRGIHFESIGWEDTLPGQGRPQELINEDLRTCDYFVLVMHGRWGSRPSTDDSKYTSGSDEEYHIALECFEDAAHSMRQLVVLFRGVPEAQLSDPGDQLQQVIDFKKKLQEKKGSYYESFDTPGEFSKLLRRLLDQWTFDDEQGRTAKVTEPSPIAPVMSDDLSTPEEPVSDDVVEDKAKWGPLAKAKALANSGDLVAAEAEYAAIAVRSNDPEVFRHYGIFLSRIGRLAHAEVMIGQAIELAKAQDKRDDEALAINNLANLKRIIGELPVAEELIGQALTINQELGRKERMAALYGNLGVIYRTRGDLDGAEEMHRKSLAIFEELGHKEGMASGYGNLSLIYRTRGDLDGAEKMHRKSLAIAEELGHKECMASEYGNLGLICQARGDLDGAEKMHRKSLAIEEELGHKEGMASEYGNLGLIFQARGDLDGSERMFRTALALNEELGRREGMAIQYGNLGAIYAKRGDSKTAEEMLRKSLAINEELGSKEGMANAHANLGTIYEMRGDLVEARRLWTIARDLYAQIGMPHMVEKHLGWIEGLDTEQSADESSPAS